MSYIEILDEARHRLAGPDREAAKQAYTATRLRLLETPTPTSTPPRGSPTPVNRQTRQTKRGTAAQATGNSGALAALDQSAACEAFWVAATYFGTHADFGYSNWHDFATQEGAPSAVTKAAERGQKSGLTTRLVACLLRIHERWPSDFYRQLVAAGLPLPLAPGYNFIEQLAKLTTIQSLPDVIRELPAYYRNRPSTVRYNHTTAQRDAEGTRQLSFKDLQAYIARHTQPPANLQPEFREPPGPRKKRKRPSSPNSVEYARRDESLLVSPATLTGRTACSLLLLSPLVTPRARPSPEPSGEHETGLEASWLNTTRLESMGPDDGVDFFEDGITAGSFGDSTNGETEMHHSRAPPPTLENILEVAEQTPRQYFAKIAKARTQHDEAVVAQEEAIDRHRQLVKDIDTNLGVEDSIPALRAAEMKSKAGMDRLERLAEVIQNARQQVEDLGGDPDQYLTDIVNKNQHDSEYDQHKTRHQELQTAAEDLSVALKDIADKSAVAKDAARALTAAEVSWKHYLACLNSVQNEDMVLLAGEGPSEDK
jgi:hypothetical protein